MNTFDTSINQALITLKSGGIIVYPTDTVWGIGCDATNATSVERIYNIKQRSHKKSMIILMSSEDMLRLYVERPSELLLSEMKLSKAPTTAIFERATHLPSNLINENGTIAIRIASDSFCRKLIEQLGRPIVSTSANVSGKPTPSLYHEIDDSILSKADYVVEYAREFLEMKNPSQIIRLNEHGELERIR